MFYAWEKARAACFCLLVVSQLSSIFVLLFLHTHTRTSLFIMTGKHNAILLFAIWFMLLKKGELNWGDGMIVSTLIEWMCPSCSIPSRIISLLI